MIRIGSAASPRWYDQSLDRLDEFIEFLVACGASSAELVLHRGEADQQTARVHVLEEAWDTVFDRFRARGIICHAHAPLHSRFRIDRWRDDPGGLMTDIRPVLDAASRFTERQGFPCVLVLHGGEREATAGFLEWACGELAGSASEVRLSLELRRPSANQQAAIDRDRESLAAFVNWVGEDRLGICWDVGHDWEGRQAVHAWNAQPDESFLSLVNHVHLHDMGGDNQTVHFPLSVESIPWRKLLRPLIRSRYAGAITLEIRYRFARALGEPWNVLADSYERARSFVDLELSGQDRSDSERATARIR